MIRQSYLSDALTSIIYRLLYLSVEHKLVEEGLKLGMLAIACKLFMPWKQECSDYEYIGTGLGNILSLLQEDGIDEKHKLTDSVLLWLIVQWRIHTPFDKTESTVPGKMFLGLGVGSWAEARGMLRSVLWVDLVNDSDGEKAFYSLCRVYGGSTRTKM